MQRFYATPKFSAIFYNITINCLNNNEINEYIFKINSFAYTKLVFPGNLKWLNM